MKRERCARCLRPDSHCLCRWIPCVPSRTHVLILQHTREVGHALNTARLAALGLENARLWQGEVFAGLQAELDQPHWYPCLLFPQAPACLPTELEVAEGRSPLLVVPDGTWRKARKIIHCNPCLHALPRIRLPEGLSSAYRLRKAPGPGALSTLEAIVHSLSGLEPGRDFSALLEPFTQMIERQIQDMGEEVYQRNYRQ